MNEEDPDHLPRDWLEAFAADELLPPGLQAWRPLVIDGLHAFLNGLPPARILQIVASQMALDEAADAHERLVDLLAHCPTLHKLGQVLARQRHLDASLRARLQALESMPPTEPIEPLLARIRARFPAESGLRLADRALAQGSVAVVLPFSWRADGQRHEGVFKVLRTGIGERLAEELALLPGIADLLAQRGDELGLPALDYHDTLAGIERLLTQEIHLPTEQDNLRRAAAFHAADADVVVPTLLPWCAADITAMARIHGSSLGAAALPMAGRAALATTAMTALIARPFFTRDDPAIFHGDLHGGNLLVTDDGRLAVLDWALTARVAKRDREAVMAAVVAGITLDAPALCAALAALGAGAADDRWLQRRIDAALDDLVAAGQVAGFDWLLGLLDGLALDGRARFDADLSVFRKSWLSLAGVLTDVAGGAAPDIALIQVGLSRFLGEMPMRWVAAPASAYSTHLSNTDLAAAMVSGWSTGARYWARRWWGTRVP